jgi:hypothetical protein
MNAMYSETTTIERKDLADAVTLGHVHQRGIGKVHRQVAIPGDARARSRQHSCDLPAHSLTDEADDACADL